MTSTRKLVTFLDALFSKFRRIGFIHNKKDALINLLPLSLCTANSECLKKIEAPKTLTHEYLLQQASSVTVNAATQMLTQTVVAILDTAEEYKKALLDTMSLLQESKELLGNNSAQQELSDLIIASRAKVNDFKNQLIQLETLLSYVEKLVVSAAETSFLAGAEFVSTSLSERLLSANTQVNEVLKNIKFLEQDFLILQKEVIFETSEYEDKK